MKRAKRIKLVIYCSRDTRCDNMGKRLKLAERWAIDSKKPMGGYVFEGTPEYAEREKEVEELNEWLQSQRDENEED